MYSVYKPLMYLNGCYFRNFMTSLNNQKNQIGAIVEAIDPVLAQQIRDQIAREILSEETGVLAEFLGSWRGRVKEKVEGYGLRKKFWESVLESNVPRLLAEGDTIGAEQAMAAMLDTASNVKKESAA